MKKQRTAAEESVRARRSAKRSRILGAVFIGLAVLFAGAGIWLMTQGMWSQGMSTLTSTIITGGSGFFIRSTASTWDDTARRWEQVARLEAGFHG